MEWWLFKGTNDSVALPEKTDEPVMCDKIRKADELAL
jgi:hypothetical protein